MQAQEIEVGQTYIGCVSHTEGFSSHRTVIAITDDLVTFRCEVGENPPECYVRNANMQVEKFAAWAEKVAPAAA